ncbi:MAG: PP2C family protein-serine/threonine phosphatase [Thermoleophilia bacterium]
MTTTDTVEPRRATAGQGRSAVSLYVAVVALGATCSLSWAGYREGMTVTAPLLAFAALAALADLKEVRLPLVGVVGMSFVPVLAALVALGLWPAMVVAMVSGAISAGFTRDPQKVVFNIANYVLSTFLAGLLYLALTPEGAGMADKVVPAFLATGVDFVANTFLLAGVVGMSTGAGIVGVWQRNYRWALPGYLAGATFALFAAWLFGLLGIAGLVLALPPLVLIYYSYEIYVSRARERVSFDAERDSFRDEIDKSVQLHDELRAAQLKVAAEIERARRIQTDLLPTSTPEVEGLELAQRMEFLGEMGGDYYDYIPFGDGRLGIVCGDVMGKGLAAALIMTMARSLLHDAIGPGKQAGQVLAEVNDGLARDLEGQRLPYFLTLALVVYDPERRSLMIAGGGHNPVLVRGADGVRRVPSRGAALGVRAGLQYPEDEVRLEPGDTVALYTDGLTEARDPDGELFGLERLEAAFSPCHGTTDETLHTVWNDVAAFRGDTKPGDDATLLLARLA